MKNIIRLTNDFIVKHGIRTLPLKFEDLQKLCTKLGYKLLPIGGNEKLIAAIGIKNINEHAATTYRHEDIKLVFFDEKLSTGTRHFAIAHEIGHIALNHNYCGALGFTKVKSPQEHEANTFAYQLLAPLPVLDALNIRSLLDIEQNTLLDSKRAFNVKMQLLFYKWQPEDDCILKVYRVHRRIDKKSAIIPLLLALAALLTLSISTHKDIKASIFHEVIQTTEIATTIDYTETVYITPHGERYHKATCYHLKNSTPSPTTLATATENGYTPCKSCFK